ncbi:MAG: T9SS type A sorting domain-containing protein [Bacteroidota bacterium]
MKEALRQPTYFYAIILFSILSLGTWFTEAQAQINGSTEVTCGTSAQYDYRHPDGDPCISTFWVATLPDGQVIEEELDPLATFWLPVGLTAGVITVEVSGQCINDKAELVNFTDRIETTVTPRTLTRPVFSGASNFLCNNETKTYTVNNVLGATNYRWEVSAGWKINGSSQTSLETSSNSITVTPPASGHGSGTIQVRALGPGGCIANSGYKSIRVDYGVWPLNFTGPTEASAGQYLLFETSGAGLDNYQWTIPNGWTIAAVNGRPWLTVKTNSNSGRVDVSATSTCGNTGVFDGRHITISGNHSGGILQRSAPCQGEDRGLDLETAENSPFRMYPNPASSHVEIELPNRSIIKSVRVFDQAMKLVYQANPESDHHTIQLDSFQNGMLIVLVDNGSHTLIQKLVVQP